MIPFLHRLSGHQQDENPLWLVVLSDMMTTLMLLFLILYANATLSPAEQRRMARAFSAEAVVNPEPDARREAAVREFQEAKVIEELKKRFSDVSVTEREIRVRLREALLFPSGSSAPSGGAAENMSAMAAILREMGNPVIVEGYTDPVPIKGRFRDNWDLSVARSNAVIGLLAKNGVEPGRLIASGYGPMRPLVPNESPDAFKINRRVEIVILREARP